MLMQLQTCQVKRFVFSVSDFFVLTVGFMEELRDDPSLKKMDDLFLPPSQKGKAEQSCFLLDDLFSGLRVPH